MGTMNLVDASVAFAQSPGPLSLEAAALETYFGGLHAASQDQTGWWGAMAPNLPMPPELAGAVVTGHEAPLDVEIDSAGGSPDQVVLRTAVTLSGGSAPGEHAMTVVLPVHGLRGDHRELDRATDRPGRGSGGPGPMLGRKESAAHRRFHHETPGGVVGGRRRR